MNYTPFFSAYIIVLAAILGLVAGSFLNCLAWRLVHGEKISRGRSHCAVCGHTLGAIELIPLVSYLIQKGRCRHCGEKISKRYPIVEAITAFVFISTVLRFGVAVQTLAYLVLSVILLIIALTDLDSYLIFDRFILAGIVLFVAYTLLFSQNRLDGLLWGLVGGLSVSLPVLIISLIADKVLKKESMGGGDIKLLFMTGLFLGWQRSILSLILACIVGIVFALIFKPKAEGEEVPQGAFPFGPAICAASWLCLMFGDLAISFYTSLF